MKLSILIPAFNEEGRIVPTLLEAIDFLKKNDLHAEIIVIDDGSRDATEFVSNETLSKSSLPFKVIRVSENQGKGAAVATGIKHSKGDYILFMDADGSTSLQEITRFYEHINPTTLIVGSRQKNKELLLVSQGGFRKFLGFLTASFHKLFFRLNVEDSQCGFKLMPKSLAISFIRKPYPKRWGFDIALIHYAKQCGFNIMEVGVQWKDIAGSKVQALPDAVSTAFELLRYRIDTFLKK